MNHIVSSFGKCVRHLRQEQGWTQETLAEHADLSRSYLGELERGRVIPSLLTLNKLSHALGVSLTNLLAQTERIAQIPQSEPSN